MAKTISKLHDKRTIVDLTASSPPPAPAGTVLKDAIRMADGKRLRLVLQKVCCVSEEASKLAQKLLLVPEAGVRYRISERDNDSDVGEDSEDSEDEDGNGD